MNKEATEIDRAGHRPGVPTASRGSGLSDPGQLVHETALQATIRQPADKDAGHGAGGRLGFVAQMGRGTFGPARREGISYAAGKRCTRCKKWLPREAFRANARLKSGLNSWCRECVVRRTQQWRAEHPEHAEQYNAARRVTPQSKRCVECGDVFTPGRKDGLVCSPHCRFRRKAKVAKGRAALGGASRASRLRASDEEAP